MGRPERHLDEQKVAQCLASGKFEEAIARPQPQPKAPTGKWPTPAYARKLAERARKRGEQANGYYIGLRRSA